MLCSEVLEIVEPLACGDHELAAATRMHFETCPRCAAALASARRLEGLLRSDGVPAAPPGFTSAVLQRIRRERWRSEQHVDRLFNFAIAVGFLLVVVAGIAMLNVDAALALVATAWSLLKSGTRDAVREAAPSVVTYIAAAGLLASALGMWWWAERSATAGR